MPDIGLAAGEIVVDAENLLAVGQESLTQVRAEKTGSAGDQGSLVS
jgi:hypothetical protein